MNLSSLLERISFKKAEDKEYFLALEIKTKEIKAAVWQKEKEKVSLVNIGQATYSGNWDEAISATDEAIIEASSDIPQEKLEKVIFGVSPSWIKENKILNPHLANLKKLCEKLSLKPLGFVVMTEALVSYLKQIEGIPPTALLLGIEAESTILTLVKAGRIEGTKELEGKEGKNLTELIEEALESFRVEILPSRILLYDGIEDLENLRNKLLSHRWSAKLPFLHLPKIETLENNFDIKALAAASGAQLGKEFPIEISQPEAQVVKETEEKATPPEITAESLGFFKDKDILDQKEEQALPISTVEIPEASESASFAIEHQLHKPEEKPQPPRQGFKLPNRPNFKLPSLPLPRIPFGLSFLGEFKIIGLSLFLIAGVLGGAFFAAYWYLPKSEVKIWVQTQPLGKELTVLVSPDQATGKVVEAQETVGDKVSATGKKRVGDPAKGKIIVYNKTENEKKFPQGSVLLSPEGLRFTLDEEIAVASTAAFSTNFSSTGGKVTAVKIGEEGNLSSGTNFSFKDYPTSSYIAKGDGDFSGGTSKEVSVVAKSDQEKLLADLSKKAMDKAKEDLHSRSNAEERFIEETLTSEIKEKKFDKEVGEEAIELNLALTMNFNAVTYNEKEVKERLLGELKTSVPQGYELNEEEVNFETLSAVTKKKETTLKIAAKANLLPKLNLEEVRSKIVGKDRSVVEQYFRGLGSVSKIEITTRPSFPSFLKTLPHLPQNIKIEVISS